MKFNQTSLLYCFTVWILIFASYGFAQEPTDSMRYYMRLALKPQNAQDLISSETYFNRHYKKASSQGEVSKAITYLYYKASIAYKKGEYDESEEFAVKALSLIDKRSDAKHMSSTRMSFYNLLGLMYTEQNHKIKTIELYTNAFKMAKSPSDSATIYNNLSLVYRKFKDLDNAKNIIRKAYNLIPKLSDTLTQALIIDNYGVITSKLNKAKGLDLMRYALKLRKAVSDTSTIYTSYSHLAEYYTRLNNEAVAKNYALKALELATHINSDAYKNNALGLLVNVSEDPYARAYKQLNDSIYTAEKESSNQYALLKYDNSEYKRKVLESELENEKHKARTIYAVLTATFITILSVLLYFILKSKYKKATLQQVFNTESRISKQIHDEVANDVYQTMCKLENQQLHRDTLLNDLHNLYYKTRDISKKHSVLNADYPFTDHLDELIESFNDGDISVIVKGLSEINWDPMPQLHKSTIYKVLQELLINMKKHSSASLVVIMFRKMNKKIQINYSDNGSGSVLKKGMGLQNTENRIQSINGSITFDTNPEKGFKAQIIL